MGELEQLAEQRPLGDRARTRFALGSAEADEEDEEMTDIGKSEAEKAREALGQKVRDAVQAAMDSEPDDLDDAFALMGLLANFASQRELGDRVRTEIVSLMGEVLHLAGEIVDEMMEGRDVGSQEDDTESGDDGADDVLDASGPHVFPERGPRV